MICMSEFTPEQEQEINKRIEQAMMAARAREQWVIAADQFFREALLAVHQKVGQQIYDPYVLEVGAQMYKQFKDSNNLGAPNEGNQG